MSCVYEIEQLIGMLSYIIRPTKVKNYITAGKHEGKFIIHVCMCVLYIHTCIARINNQINQVF